MSVFYVITYAFDAKSCAQLVLWNNNLSALKTNTAHSAIHESCIYKIILTWLMYIDCYLCNALHHGLYSK